jgi:hypothetical protein
MVDAYMDNAIGVVEGTIDKVARAKTKDGDTPQVELHCKFPWSRKFPQILYVNENQSGVTLDTPTGEHKFQLERSKLLKNKPQGSTTLWEYRFDLLALDPQLETTPTRDEYKDVFIPELVGQDRNIETSADPVNDLSEESYGDPKERMAELDALNNGVEIAPDKNLPASQGGANPIFGRTPKMDYRSAVIQWQNARTTAIAMIDSKGDLYGAPFYDDNAYENAVLELAMKCFQKLWPSWLAPFFEKAAN